MDGVLLVVGAGTVKRDVVRKAKAQLEAVNARLLDIAVNNVPFEPAQFAGYFDQADQAT